METIFYIFTFLLGTIIGSFLNVVIYRYDTGESSLKGRSVCLSCKKTLKWYELVPIVSFIVQLGKCRNCRTNISLQYPIVEIITGILFLLVFSLGHSVVTSTLLLLIMSILVVISVYDFWHKIIPDVFVFIFIALSGFLLIWNSEFQIPKMLDVLAGPILFLPFALLWYFSDGTWMGFGDAKLAWGIGWFLGLRDGGSAIILSFWLGAIFGLLIIAFHKIPFSKNIPLISSLKMFTMKSEIPFGPFMVLGTLLVFFFNISPLYFIDMF